MKKLFHRKAFVYAALLFWLFASASGMHGHYCFDGMEQPVSVHFDLLSSHNDDVGHKDIDSNPQISVLKVIYLGLPFLIALSLLAIIWCIVCGQQYTLYKTPVSGLSVTPLRPPLRAPPAITA